MSFPRRNNKGFYSVLLLASRNSQMENEMFCQDLVLVGKYSKVYTKAETV